MNRERKLLVNGLIAFCWNIVLRISEKREFGKKIPVSDILSQKQLFTQIVGGLGNRYLYNLQFIKTNLFTII